MLKPKLFTKCQSLNILQKVWLWACEIFWNPKNKVKLIWNPSNLWQICDTGTVSGSFSVLHEQKNLVYFSGNTSAFHGQSLVKLEQFTQNYTGPNAYTQKYTGTSVMTNWFL